MIKYRFGFIPKSVLNCTPVVEEVELPSPENPADQKEETTSSEGEEDRPNKLSDGDSKALQEELNCKWESFRAELLKAGGGKGGRLSPMIFDGGGLIQGDRSGR